VDCGQSRKGSDAFLVVAAVVRALAKVLGYRSFVFIQSNGICNGFDAVDVRDRVGFGGRYQRGVLVWSCRVGERNIISVVRALGV